MVKCGQNLRFAFETAQAIRIIGKMIGKDLQSDRALQLSVPRAIDDAHSSFAKRRCHFVRSNAGARCDRHKAARLSLKRLKAANNFARHGVPSPQPAGLFGISQNPSGVRDRRHQDPQVGKA